MKKLCKVLARLKEFKLSSVKPLLQSIACHNHSGEVVADECQREEVEVVVLVEL